MVSPYGVILCCYLKRFSFALKISFLSNVTVFSCEMSFKTSIELFFFPCLFSGYFHSVGPRIVSIISCVCNQSPFTLFYVVFNSLYRCINAVFNFDESSSFSCSLVHLFKLFSGPLQEWYRVSYKVGDNPSTYLFGKVTAIQFCFEWLSRSPEILFLIFL